MQRLACLTLGLLAGGLLLVSCSAGNGTSKAPPKQPPETASQPVELPDAGATPTQVEMVNVNIHLDESLIMRIKYLKGQFLPTKKGRPPTFDDKLSYVIAIDSAEIAVSMASMTHAMNTYVFNDPDAPLKNLKLSAEGTELKQTGTLKKGIGIPFEMVGTMSPTPEGLIRIHPNKTKAAHLPVKGLMKVLGLDMAKLINTRKTRGITVEENDLIMDPSAALPPPKIRGRVTSVAIVGDSIVQTFGKPSNVVPTRPPSNYMAYRGGILTFGKLTMKDADMRLVDADPSDVFDFYPDHYNEHLVAGYSKTTASGGLIVYMPDYNKLHGPTKGQATQRP
ncbi:MAG: hypothetical protein ABI806_13055 [Candidatus Solibacter sp.]